MNSGTDPENVSKNDDKTTETPSTEKPKKPFVLPIADIEHKWYQNGKLWAIVTVLLVIVGAVAGYMVYAAMNKPAAPVATASVKPVILKPAVPYAMMYSVEKLGKQTDKCLTTEHTLYQKPLDGTDAVTALKLGDNQTVGVSAVYKNQVLIATSPSCASKDGPTLWLSTNSGISFDKLYVGESNSAAGTSDSITSVEFSNDGKSAIFGYLSNDSQKNTVKEIDVTTKNAKDLFTVDDRGVYIKGYDRSKQSVYYFRGCYGCDGQSQNKLLVHNIANNTDDVVFTDTSSTFSYMTVMNSDFSKVAQIKYSTPDPMNSNPKTNIIEMFDVASKKRTELVRFDSKADQGASVIGSANDGSIYYTNANDLYDIEGPGKTNVVLKADKPIAEVYYVGKDMIVYRVTYKTGTSTHGTLIKYDVKTKKSLVLLDYTDDSNTTTNVIHLAWK